MGEPDDLIERLSRFYREARHEVPSTPPAWSPGHRQTVRWLTPVLASMALVALAAGLAVTLRTVRDQAIRARTTPSPAVSAAPTPTPLTSPSASATSSWVARHVPVGQVTAMALDDAAVFVLFAPTPAEGGIDPN